MSEISKKFWNAVFDRIDPIFGFSKNGHYFVKRHPQIWLFVQIQISSTFKDGIYINIGAYFPALEPDNKRRIIPSYEWQLYERLEMLIETRFNAITFQINEQRLEDDANELAILINKNVLPILEGFKDLELLANTIGNTDFPFWTQLLTREELKNFLLSQAKSF